MSTGAARSGAIEQGERLSLQITSGQLTARGIVVSTRQDDVRTALAALKDNLDLMVRAWSTAGGRSSGIEQGEQLSRQLTSGQLTARGIVVSTRQDDVRTALAALNDNLDLMVRA